MHERPCPVNGCRTWIGEELMCARHWRKLPDAIVAAIERARRLSRSRDTAAYRAACQTAINWFNHRPRRRRGRVEAHAPRRRFASAFHPGS